MRALSRREEKKTRAKKKRRSSPRERAKRRKKRATSTPARPSNRAFERRNAILIQRIALESTSRFGKPSTFAPRENFSLRAFASFPTRNACSHPTEREKNTFCAKNVQLQKSTFLKDHPNATSFNLPHSPRRRRKTIYRRVSLLAWRVQPYSFCYAFARNFSFFLMRSE